MTVNWLLVSSGWLHPGLLARREVMALPRKAEGLTMTRARSLEILSPRRQKDRPPLREQYNGILLLGKQDLPSFEALDTLFAFVEEGGGLALLHNASASFSASPAFAEMAGGRFLQEEMLRKFTLVPDRADDPILGALESFTLFDQPCLHACDPRNVTHYRAQLGERLEPFIWTRQYGTGRVFYCAAGHTATALRNPTVQHALVMGLTWAGGQEQGENESAPSVEGMGD